MATAYGGLRPWGAVLHTQLWPVVTSYGTALYRGTPVQVVNDGTVAIAVVGASTFSVGAILALFDSDMNPISYLPATTVGDGTYAAYVLVADSPDQDFLIAEDSDTTPLTASAVHMNISLILGTGDTTTGLSSCMLDSSTIHTTNTLQYRVLKMAPIMGNTLYNATTCPNPLWVVRNLYHQHENILGI